MTEGCLDHRHRWLPTCAYCHIEELKEQLRWYANMANYQCNPLEGRYSTPTEIDKGQRARAALNKTHKKPRTI